MCNPLAALCVLAVHLVSMAVASPMHDTLRPRGRGLLQETPNQHRRWAEIANGAGTDKYSLHWYQHLYEDLLEPVRHLPVRFMEIGLGCTSAYGPGRSYKVWDEFFDHPDAQLYYLELHGDCVEKMNIRPRNGRVFIGSQDNTTFLKEVAKAVEGFGGLDILVDDGGHSMGQQLNTLGILWPHIRPHGLFIVEDIQTSYVRHFGGTTDTDRRNDHTIARPTTFMGRMVELLDVLNCDYSDEDCDMDIRSIAFYHHAAVLRKMSRDGDHVNLEHTDGQYVYPGAYQRKYKDKKQ